MAGPPQRANARCAYTYTVYRARRQATIVAVMRTIFRAHAAVLVASTNGRAAAIQRELRRDAQGSAWGLETTHESGCFIEIRVRCRGWAVSELDRHRPFAGGAADTRRIMLMNNVIVEPLSDRKNG